MDVTPTVRAEHDDYRVASWRNLVLVLWLRSPGATAVRALIRSAESVSQKNAGGSVLLTVVESHVPSSGRRDPLAEFLTEVGGRTLRASAVVYERSGFGAAAMRGIITGLSLQGQHAVEHLLFNTVEAAGASVLQHIATGNKAATARDVVKVVAALRSGNPSPQDAKR